MSQRLCHHQLDPYCLFAFRTWQKIEINKLTRSFQALSLQLEMNSEKHVRSMYKA